MDGETPASDFVAAFSEHRTKLLRLLGSFADAEDMVQQTLLRAWRARGTYSAGAPLTNWLMRIATNACLTHLDRRGPRHLPQFERVAADPSAPFESLEAVYWVTPAPDAELFRGPQEAQLARPSQRGVRRGDPDSA